MVGESCEMTPYGEWCDTQLELARLQQKSDERHTINQATIDEIKRRADMFAELASDPENAGDKRLVAYFNDLAHGLYDVLSMIVSDNLD